MIKIDEKDLSNLVFCAYMDSDDLSDYAKKIKNLANRSNLTIRYLRSLRETYVKYYAHNNEKKEYLMKKKIMNDKKNRFIKFCDDLFNLPDDSRLDYLLSNNVMLSELKEYFDEYKKYNGQYSSLVDDCFNAYKNFKKQINQNVKSEYLKSACEYYDNLTNLGFYSITSYARYLNDSEYGVKKEIVKAFSFKNSIVSADKSLWDLYLSKMEINKKRNFLMIKDKVDILTTRLKEHFSGVSEFDIIDYYMLLGMPLEQLKEICTDFISDLEMSYFNNFYRSYLPLDRVTLDDKKILDTSYQFNDRVITEEEKLSIICFLHNNNIPLVYFPCAALKYVNGNLFGKQKKKNF